LSDKTIIICGAGGYGRRALEYYRESGRDVVAFCDNDEAKQKSGFCATKVLSLQAAVSLGHEIVVAVNPAYQGQLTDQLRALGCQQYSILNVPDCLDFHDFVEKGEVPAAPRAIFIDPCGKCNFKCRFCPTNNSKYKSRERHALMPFSLFRKIVDDISGFDVPVSLFLYGYGEPLQNPALPDMIHYAKQKGIAKDVSLTSNGSLLNPALNTALVASGLDSIRISIEALDREGYRKIAGVKFDFEHFIDNIADLHRKAKGKPEIVAKIIDMAFEDEKATERFERIFSPITDRQYVEKAEGYWQDFSFEPTDHAEVKAVSWLHAKEDDLPVCLYPWIHMMIFSNGDVGLCCSDWKHSTKYGSVLTDKLVDLWGSATLATIRKMHASKRRKEIPMCAWCRKNYFGI
jgi:MoaA/NifB/PqqE/SkfB family radical SAM enzyme